MKLPKTFAELIALRPHAAKALTFEERLALPEAQWHAYTAPQHQHLRSINTDGEWYIGHPHQRGNGEPDPVELAYMQPRPSPEEYAKIDAAMDGLDTSDLAWWENYAARGKMELGSVYNQDYARRFVELARRQPAGRDPIETLLRAGFKEREDKYYLADRARGSEKRSFTLEDSRRGEFSVTIAPWGAHMTHQKRHSNYWTNLFHLSMGQESNDGSMFIPTFWPREVADPISAMAEMATVFVREWEPVRRVSRKMR